ncbi:GH-E family nuclease [Mycobacteroides abscessus]|uniref:GH-E family nuclease n=1 Tax=Mycobacteroides abscessus TaxID=36809 RepID=UPI00025870C1|nr:GH-E family nuclease [Mycobacteroides abscessus]EIC70344.1 hypothetical protein S7W_05498 [Mycobacteroides abscessus M94]SLA08311.1 Uncharacterised protein [Mycobacteroides abscessus subsp. abscessus]
MSLSVGELKKVSVQSIRDIATGLRAKATSMRATQAGVTDLPHKGTWTGVAADNADHEIGTFAQGVGRDAEAYENAARKVDGAGDEFEGLKQLLSKLENEAAGKFAINEATGEVTPLTKDFNKSDRDYIANTLKQLCAAGGQANDDLAAGIHATDASGTTSPANATGALPAMPGSAIKPDGVAAGLQNLAAPNPDGDPGATRAAAAAGADTQANYKEWYPKTPGSSDKLTIDPSKAGSLTGTVGALAKLPGAPKPADGFGTGVARQFGQGVNSRVDGIIDEAKNLTGQGAPGSPGVAESWAKFALGTADQMANPLGSLPGEVKDAVNDPAGFAGKKLFDVSSIAATGPLGGEATAGARGLLGDLTGAETRALTHGIDDATPGHPSPPVADHQSAPSQVDHSAPSGERPAGPLPPHGEPGSYGYDADGNRLPYANGGRPNFGPGQVEETWHISREEQMTAIGDGELNLPKPGADQQWVELHPNGPRGEDWTVENDHRLIEWRPGEPRDGLWDMGHRSGEEYRNFKDEYLRGDLPYDKFIEIYRDPDNYRVQDPYRNRSHIDEGP